jgi:hypothetical protein
VACCAQSPWFFPAPTRNRSILSITVESTNLDSNEYTRSVLNLVDLAGSERLAHSHAVKGPRTKTACPLPAHRLRTACIMLALCLHAPGALIEHSQHTACTQPTHSLRIPPCTQPTHSLRTPPCTQPTHSLRTSPCTHCAPLFCPTAGGRPAEGSHFGEQVPVGPGASVPGAAGGQQPRAVPQLEAHPPPEGLPGCARSPALHRTPHRNARASFAHTPTRATHGPSARSGHAWLVRATPHTFTPTHTHTHTHANTGARIQANTPHTRRAHAQSLTRPPPRPLSINCVSRGTHPPPFSHLQAAPPRPS